MAYKEIKKFEIFSVAKVHGLLLAFIGLIIGFFFGIIMSFAGMVAGGMENNYFLGAGLSSGLGFFAIVLFPIFYGIIGFVAGALGAVFYNLIASWVGGVKIEFKD